jgi:hypothetical protein
MGYREAVELFGSTHTAYIAVGCWVTYLCSSQNGIYLSQRLASLGVRGVDEDVDLTLAGSAA